MYFSSVFSNCLTVRGDLLVYRGMSETWYTSDLHLSHSNILRFCNRPFDNVEEMNETLIANYNECVNPGDDVYILGDFAFHNGLRHFRRLNGNKHLILGNHDKRNRIRGILFAWVKDVYLQRVGDTKIWLSHYSHRRWPSSHHGSIHLYGHGHHNSPFYGRSLDVGVDGWDYRPVNLDTIIDLIADRQPLPGEEWTM